MKIYRTKFYILIFLALFGALGCKERDGNNAAGLETPMSYEVGGYRFEFDDSVRVVSRKNKNRYEHPAFIMRFSLAGDVIPGSVFEPGDQHVRVEIKPYENGTIMALPNSQIDGGRQKNNLRFVRAIPEWELVEYHRPDFDGGWGYVQYYSSGADSGGGHDFQCKGSVQKGVDECWGHFKRDGYFVWYFVPFALMPKWKRVLDSVNSKVDSFSNRRLGSD